MTQFDCDLIVNAGGASRRMGVDKALLRVPPDGTPLLRTIIERLAGLVSGQIFVITNDEALAAKAGLPSSVRQIPDDYPGSGALGGLATGLARCSGWAMALACDMPLINPRLLARLATVAQSPGPANIDGVCLPWDAVVPLPEGHPQPLHALYHRRCLPAIEATLLQGDLRFVDFYDAIRVYYVDDSSLREIDPKLRSFHNVNTPEEWQQALMLIPSQSI